MSKEQTKTDIFQYIKATDRVPKQGHAGYLALRIGGEPYRGWYDDGNFYVTVGTPIKIEYVEWAEPYSQLQQENKELREHALNLSNKNIELIAQQYSDVEEIKLLKEQRDELLKALDDIVNNSTNLDDGVTHAGDVQISRLYTIAYEAKTKFSKQD